MSSTHSGGAEVSAALAQQLSAGLPFGGRQLPPISALPHHFEFSHPIIALPPPLPAPAPSNTHIDLVAPQNPGGTQHSAQPPAAEPPISATAPPPKDPATINDQLKCES